jgi:hypothetical protein
LTQPFYNDSSIFITHPFYIDSAILQGLNHFVSHFLFCVRHLVFLSAI